MVFHQFGDALPGQIDAAVQMLFRREIGFPIDGRGREVDAMAHQQAGLEFAGQGNAVGDGLVGSVGEVRRA